MTIEVISPGFKVGDRVRHTMETHITGTIARLYPASGVPLWYGTRRLIHTHCYELTTPMARCGGLSMP
jgi:hypothetical protein